MRRSGHVACGARLPGLFALLGLLALDASALAGRRGVTWRGARVAADAAELPPEARGAVSAWTPFAEEHGYELTLVGDGRLLLVSEGGRSTTTRRLELIDRTLALFDADLPPPPSASSAAATSKEPRNRDTDEIPEDPEGPPPGWEPATPATQAITYEWGGASAPDTETIVLLVLRDEEHYGAALDVLSGLAPELADWTRSARADLGFVLERPLAGAYVLNASGQEEWNPDNELVNRVARLCLLSRFGQQPHWLAQGYAWHVELALLKAVYVFPHRSEFVYATEHTGWDKEVARRLADGPPDLRELTEWKRGTYDAAGSRLAWALVDWILRAHPGTLSLLCDDLRRFRDEDNKQATSATTWQRNRDYDVPGSKQRALFQERLGKSFLRDLAKAYE